MRLRAEPEAFYLSITLLLYYITLSSSALPYLFNITLSVYVGGVRLRQGRLGRRRGPLFKHHLIILYYIILYYIMLYHITYHILLLSLLLLSLLLVGYLYILYIYMCVYIYIYRERERERERESRPWAACAPP